jgi:hypothetical protein
VEPDPERGLERGDLWIRDCTRIAVHAAVPSLGMLAGRTSRDSADSSVC